MIVIAVPDIPIEKDIVEINGLGMISQRKA